MPPKKIYIKGRRKEKTYYYYDTFSNAEKADKIAQYYKKKINARYFVLKEETIMFREMKWHLYFDKVMRLWPGP